MLSFRRRLQQVCPQSLVLPSLDLTRLLELLLDLQLLRLCSGWTEGKWGRGEEEGEEEEEEQEEEEQEEEEQSGEKGKRERERKRQKQRQGEGEKQKTC